MTIPDQKSPKPARVAAPERPARRRWLYRLLLLAAVLSVGWKIVEHLIAVDRYRPLVIDAIGQATGLPVTVGSLDLDIFPLLRVTADEITVGENDFKISISRAQATPRIFGLLQHRIYIASIVLSDLTIKMPQDAAILSDHIEALLAAQSKADSGKPAADAFAVEIDNVYANSARLYVGDSEIPFSVCDVTLRNPLSDTVSLLLSAEAASFGTDMRLNAEITVEPHAGPAVRGTASIKELDVRTLLRLPWLPETRVALQANIENTEPSRFSAALTGNVDGRAINALDGAFSATAWWDDGAITINDLAWESPGALLKGDVTRAPDGSVACHIREAVAGQEILASLLVRQPVQGFSFKTHKTASAETQDLLIGLTPGEPFRIAKGALSFRGIDMALKKGPVVFSNLAGRATLDEGTIHLQELTGDGVALSGTITPDFATGIVPVDCSGAIELTKPLVALLAPALDIKDIGGTLKCTHISGTFGVGGELFPADMAVESSLDGGSISIVLSPESPALALGGLRGDMSFEKGTFAISRLEGEGFSLKGSVKLDPEGGKIGIDFAGTTALDAPYVRSLLPHDAIGGLGGTVTFKRMAATLVRSAAMPTGIIIEGALADGRIEVNLPEYTDAFTSVSADFATRDAALGLTVAAESAKLGPVQCEGAYTWASHTTQAGIAPPAWNGTLACDVERAATAFLKTPPVEPTGVSLFSLFGSTRFDIAATLPFRENNDLVLHLVHQTEPFLEGDFTLTREHNAWRLGTIRVLSRLPIYALKPFLPPAIDTEGLATVKFDYNPSQETFEAAADLKESRIALDEYVAKKTGDPLDVIVKGAASETGWKLNAGTIAYQGVRIPFRFDPNGAVSVDLDLDITPFAALLPEGAKTWGHVRGTLATQPLRVALTMDNIGFVIVPPLGIDSINGAIRYDETGLACKDVRIQGANSDCTVTAEFGVPALAGLSTDPAKDGITNESGWRGTVKGEKLDFNALAPILAMVSALRSQTAASTTSTASTATSGIFDVDIQSLFFRRATIEDVRAKILIENEAIHVKDLACRPYGGTLTGTADFMHLGEPKRPCLVLDLAMDTIDARAIDEILFEKPRHFAGILSGKAALTVPLDIEEPINGATGSVVFTAKNGTFGKLGFATKMLAVLQATDVLRLRLPSFKDKGLTYDTCTGTFTIKDGFMTVEGVQLKNPSLAMDAAGTVDFPELDTDVLVRLNLLKSVTGLVENVPVIGGVTEKVTGYAGWHLLIKGSPYDPNVRLEPVRAVNTVRKKAGSAASKIINKVVGH